MIYLDNNQLLQEIYIPRQEYSSSSNPEYATKTELENAIENEVIRADEKYAAKTDLIPYATTGWVESQDYVNSEEMASAITDAITSETARTEETYQKISEMSAYSTTNEVESMIDDAVSGKMDTSAMSAYSTTQEMNQAIDDSAAYTTGWVASQGYLTGFTETDPIFTGSPAYGITSQDITNWNSVSGKADASKFNDYTPSSGFSTINGSAITSGEAIVIETGGNYSAGTNIQIEDNVISVTGITVPTKLSDLDNDEGFITSGDIPTSNTAFTNDAGYITTADTQDFVTSGDVKTQIEGYGYITENALSGYSTTEEMNQAIDDAVSGKADSSAFSAYSTTSEVENMIASAKTEIEAEIPSLDGYATEVYVDNAVSGKADTTALTQYYTSAQTDTAISNAVSGLASTQYVDNSVSGKADTSEFSAYTPTSGFSTINGSAITEGGNITVEETPYSGGTNIQIEDHVISVTGITVPTKVSDLENDEGFITNEAISGLASETYVDNAVSGKADSSAVTADISAATAATTGWVENQGYLTAFTETDPVFTGSPAYGITSEDISNWNSVSGKVDTSAMTAYYTSGETNTAISNATSGLASTTYVDNSVSGKMDTSAMTEYATTGWVNEQGFLTAFTETDPIFTGSPAYGITAQDIANWNAATGGSAYSAGQNINIDANNEISVTGITSYTGITSGDVTTALGYTPISGVDLSDYYTSAQTDSAITNAVSGKADSSRVDEIEEVTASALTDLKTSKQDTLVSGTNIKTINNESILGSGNITIQGGGGSGETFVELTKAQYEALTAYSENTTYVITDADAVNLDDFVTTGNLQSYYTSAETDTAIANAVSGKTDKVSVTANTGRQFPRWNTQGVVTGTTGNTVYEQSLNINGTSKTMLQTTNSSFGTIYAPTSAGSQGQPLLSNGSGAPVWGSYKFQFISQSAYDAITTKDSTTIYFIISEN